MGRRKTRAEASVRWRAIVDGWDAGAESAAAYCQRKDVAATSFYRWRKRLSVGGSGRSRFLPVTIVEAQLVDAAACAPVTGAGVEIALRGDRRIRIEAGFDEDVLRRAVGVLESC